MWGCCVYRPDSSPNKNSWRGHASKLDGVGITPIENGSNVYNLKLGNEINLKELTSYLYSTHNISLGRANEQGLIKFKVNETLLERDLKEILNAWNTGIDMAS